MGLMLSLFLVGLSSPWAMLYPDLRLCNFTRNTVAFQIVGLDARPIECSSWRRLEADMPFQCETVKLFEGPCQNADMDSVRIFFDSDRYGRCIIPFVKVTSPGKIDVLIERQEGEMVSGAFMRLPMSCRWLYH